MRHTLDPTHRTTRRLTAALAAALTAALTTGALASAAPAPASASPAPAPVPGLLPATGRHQDPHLLRLLRSMPLRDKAAQLFVLQVHGTSADTTAPADVAANRRLYGADNAAQVIARYHPGGFIYYSAGPANVQNPRQLAAFSNGIQRAATAQPLPIPATIATDQEGGIVARVQPPATQSPGAMALAAGRRTADARALAAITGRELRAVGVNQDYAPDADVNVDPANPVIGVRSFGSDPALVSRMVTAQIDGYRAGGVTPTVKHFPGHGDTTTDSHTGVPRIGHTRAEWERLDLPPFRAAVARGADAIMTAHIIVPALDPSEDPATLSRPILTGILRDRLHYRGVIVTDALDMQGVRDKYGDERVPVLALKAGADVLLKPPADASGTGVFPRQLDAVVTAVRTGELTEQRLDASVYRVLELKKRRGLFRDPYADESRIGDVVGAPAHLAAAQRATDRTTTLVKNDARLLPLRPGPRRVLVTGWGAATTTGLAAEMTARGATATVRETGLSPTPARIAQAVAAARDQDLLVAVTNRAWDVKDESPHNGPGQRDLVKALAATGKPVIVVAARDPYDIAWFPETPTYLATYSATAEAVRSTAKVLYGETRPRGRLPVTITAADDPAAVLYRFGHGLRYRR
ncbi:glycoside hydrolase family 3 protein [Actinomadura sp. NEAU-AAG7]|uniref:glycoside hydrolase family 3 protein n=1 Tax=Actinomadura sp. NEAU-AAG7 TaxID=2839640 RepID=UPI001BE3F014|nr:glycoside hydrolase family 3 protein [Actinomadura sp. NEAU-AAG7]MBT2212190.1 glycoside hydrolase family 3 protein [Actinomadura sp. NEAU-AAG7]